ncbi:MAG: phosphoglucosamine mutase [Tepidisphaera sp.]|nr:phosphoglucosamine mutase [Tepidisphaera sp.]
MASPLMLSVSGCRGVVGESLTPEVATRFAATFGTFLRERAGERGVTVVIGRDGRRGGEMVQHAAIAGLIGVGCDVMDLGVAMTPTTAVMTDAVGRTGRGRMVAGMVLTASHNPQMWNGLKCLLAEGGEHGSAACAPAPELAGRVIEAFKTGKTGWRGWEQIGTIQSEPSAADEHVDRVMHALEAAKVSDVPSRLGEGVRVAVDSVNASGVEGARLCLESLGCEEILHIGAGANGLFPHAPEPTKENLSQPGGLCDAVVGGECAVGFAQDPDADRLAIIDERGRYIGEEYTLALCAMALLEASGSVPDAVLVTNLSTSRMLDDVAERYGAKVLRTPVGEAHVVAAMKREAAAGRTVICGGEGNGGLIWPRVTYVRDSLAAMALVVSLLEGGRRTVSELVEGLPRYAIEKRKKELLRREDGAGVLDALAKRYAGERVDTSDGVWVDLASRRAWLHVRASNTEPIMRFIAEAPTSAEANALLDEAMGA